MLALALLLSLGQAQFVEHPLPDVRIGNVTPFTGRVTTNFLHGDVDHDGDADLLLAGMLYPQNNGEYSESTRIPLPAPSQHVDVDIHKGTLFYWSHDRLWVYAFVNGGWRVALSQAVPGGSRDEYAFRRDGRESPALRFRRFLQDIDGDGTPELVAIDDGGAHLFRRREGSYAPAGTLALPATIAATRNSAQVIWPADSRMLRFPEQQMTSRLVFDGSTLRTVSVDERRQETTRYSITTLTLSLNEEDVFRAGVAATETPEALPAHLRPCQLNEDGALDFAGGRWLQSEATAVPTQLYELWATLDGGATFHVRRTAAYAQFRPHSAFVDFDGDGDMDMVTESTEWPRASIREQLNQFLSESRLFHVVRVYEQKGGAFSEEPSLRHRVRFELESPPVRPGAMLARYEAGSLINLTGDMNGDGCRDLLIRSAPDRIDLYLSTAWLGFGRTASWSRQLLVDDEVFVADLNDDGLSDIYVQHGNGTVNGETAAGTVCYSRRGRP